MKCEDSNTIKKHKLRNDFMLRRIMQVLMMLKF